MADDPLLTGQMFVARFEYLKQLHGPESIDRVLGALSAEDRERLRGLDREGWYPFGTLVRFDKAVARVLAPDDPEIFERLGAASSMIRNEWLGEHASLVSVHAFLSRAADEHRRFHNFGRATYHRTGFTEGEIGFFDYPEVDETYCLGARGYLRATVELITHGPATITERSCQCHGAERCLFALNWLGTGSFSRPTPKRP